MPRGVHPDIVRDIAYTMISLKEVVNPTTYEYYKEDYEALTESDKSIIRSMAKPICKDFLSSEEGQSGDTKFYGYKACCEFFDLCKFYKQTWFFLVCGGAAFLLLLVAVGIVVFFLWRKKKRGGKGTAKGNVKSAELF
ncbi:hypothetical protein CAEBREN_18416 [Caenorhabditis brenneri]|uniref:Uncharacterized protein n=1 Tax=Caenorhabditis brenneri TaxID=135651 RepID=G0MDI8_CAEBE|nr:hypothetical protein CAEBREN_18416 [Caenorhabditis brenneri]